MHSSNFFGQGTLVMRPGKQDPRWGRAAWGTGVVQVRVREDLSAQALGVRGGMGGVRTQDPREDGAWACLRRDSGTGRGGGECFQLISLSSCSPSSPAPPHGSKKLIFLKTVFAKMSPSCPTPTSVGQDVSEDMFVGGRTDKTWGQLDRQSHTTQHEVQDLES